MKPDSNGTAMHLKDIFHFATISSYLHLKFSNNHKNLHHQKSLPWKKLWNTRCHVINISTNNFVSSVLKVEQFYIFQLFRTKTLLNTTLSSFPFKVPFFVLFPVLALFSVHFIKVKMFLGNIDESVTQYLWHTDNPTLPCFEAPKFMFFHVLLHIFIFFFKYDV